MSKVESDVLGKSHRLHETYENALRDCAFVRSLLVVSDDCVKIVDLDGRLQMMSPGGLRVMEIDDFTPFEGCDWLQLWDGPHADDARIALDTARAGKIARFEGYANTAKGTRKYWDVRVSPILDEQGKPRALTVVSRDMTLVKELEARRQESLAEMRHRAKNALTIVQAIAMQTLKSGGEAMHPIGRAFTQRLQALARSYDALVLRDWTSASLRELLNTTLEPFDDNAHSRIRLEGPDAELAASNAMALGLALNELATNAAKYGALSNGAGTVDVAWTASGDPRRLSLIWRESGGPKVQPPARRGFGTNLIDRALPGELGGSVRIQYEPSGVVCEIDAPLVC